MKLSQYKEIIKNNKYKAKKAFRNFQGKTVTFDSKFEAQRFDELFRLLRAKKISNLELQPQFLLQDKFTLAYPQNKSGESTISAIKYTPDFKYIKEDKVIVEEVKGHKTKDYQLRKRMFLYKARDFNIDEFHEVLTKETNVYIFKQIK